MAWQTRRMAPAPDLLAPDGSEIRELVQVPRGSLVHCTLQPGQVTQAVQHRTVDEVWFCVAGSGQVWRKAVSRDAVAEAHGNGREEVVDVEPGLALSIPLGVAFQFRAHGSGPFEVLIATMPPWPGHDEAVPVDGLWEVSS